MPTSGPRLPKDDVTHLKTFCWCMRTQVKVSVRRIRKGLTETCGKNDCNPRHPAAKGDA